MFPFSLTAAALSLAIDGVPADRFARRAQRLVQCEGIAVPPILTWSGAPRRAKGFAVTMFDPDAPTDSGWWHWMVVNLPASTRSYGGAEGGGLVLRNDDGTAAYGAPCPPRGGVHRYVLTVWAVDQATLPLDPSSTPAAASFMLRQHAPARVSVVLPIRR